MAVCVRPVLRNILPTLGGFGQRRKAADIVVYLVNLVIIVRRLLPAATAVMAARMAVPAVMVGSA